MQEKWVVDERQKVGWMDKLNGQIKDSGRSWTEGQMDDGRMD